MLRRLILILGILLMVLGIGQISLNAQIANMPLILTINGDYSTWTGPGAALQARTSWGYNKVPQLSPDGKSLAYKSTAQVVIDALKTFGHPGGAGDLPATIWLMNITTNNAIRIADQPKDAVIFDPKKAANYILRSDPTWSPDGQFVAWTEMAINKSTTMPTASLVVYSVADNSATTLVDSLPTQANYEGYAPIPVKWGTSGLAINVSYVDTAGNELSSGGTIYVYDTDGELVANSEKIQNLHEFVWIQDGNTEHIALIIDIDGGGDMKWQLLNPTTGQTSALTGTPELYSIKEPGRLSIFPAQLEPMSNWMVVDYGAATLQPIALPTELSARYMGDVLAISDDGAEIAYINNNQVLVNNLKTTFIASSGVQVEAIVWSPTAWRIQQEPVLQDN